MRICRQILRKGRKLTDCFVRGESGQALAAAVLAFTVLVGCAALAVDLGTAYVVQQRLQSAADEAALAAARVLAQSGDSAGVVEAALEYAELNGVPRDNTAVTVPCGGDPYQVEVICTRRMNYVFAGVLGHERGTVQARAVAECQTLRGPFDYAVFSGNTNFELPFNTGSTTVNGSIHSNDRLALRSGGITVNGDAEAVNRLSMNGGITVNGECIAAQIVQNGSVSREGEKGPLREMPDFSDIVKEAAAQAGTCSKGNKRYNGSDIYVDDPIYVEGDITFNAATVVSGSGIIIATGNITFNAACVLSPGSSVCFYSKNGNITINAGEMRIDGLLYAPNGTIRVNTSKFIVNGRIAADKLQLNVASIEVNCGEHDRDCLPRLEVMLIE